MSFPITTDDIRREEGIYGPQISTIKCKAIMWIPDYHKITQIIPLPPLMSKHHHNVELSIDYLCKGETFTMNQIKVGTIMQQQILKQVSTNYKDGGFTVTYYHSNN